MKEQGRTESEQLDFFDQALERLHHLVLEAARHLAGSAGIRAEVKASGFDKVSEWARH